MMIAIVKRIVTLIQPRVFMGKAYMLTSTLMNPEICPSRVVSIIGNLTSD
jgi:hypothetical protein